MHRQVAVLIAKHEALLDEEALGEMRAAADEKKAESLAAKRDSPEDLVRVSLVAKKEASPLPPNSDQILANKKAKVTMLLLSRQARSRQTTMLSGSGPHVTCPASA